MEASVLIPVTVPKKPNNCRKRKNAKMQKCRKKVPKLVKPLALLNNVVEIVKVV
jgi:hypothetical protein